VRRGPRRDLIAPIADAVRAAGLRFGVYYSGGLDWHVTDYPALRSGREVSEVRPRDAAYNAYAMLHVRDLIERYRPDVLWNDIEWPDAGKRTGGWSLHELFADYYSAVPDGVVNDRWGIPYADYKTSEYEHGLENESAAAWENCRGIGFSFGFNQIEDERQILTGAELARHLTDVVSRGGRLLLNVGPTAAGEIPAIQQRSLRSLGRWMDQLGHLLSSSRPVDPAVATPSDDPWIRWLETDDQLVGFVDRIGETTLAGRLPVVDDGPVELRGAVGRATSVDGRIEVVVEEITDGPAAVLLPSRR
jgi:alpha-L-fucosidase